MQKANQTLLADLKLFEKVTQLIKYKEFFLFWRLRGDFKVASLLLFFCIHYKEEICRPCIRDFPG